MNTIQELLTGDVVTNITSNLDKVTHLIPEIKLMIGFEHKHPHHHLDVWEHTLYALSMSEDDFEIRMALLLHDLGKPLVYQEGDVRHYYGHASVSALLAQDILESLGCKQPSIDRICYLIKYHDTDIRTLHNDRELLIKLYKVQECDALAHHPDKLEKRKQYLEDIKTKVLKIGD